MSSGSIRFGDDENVNILVINRFVDFYGLGPFLWCGGRTVPGGIVGGSGHLCGSKHLSLSSQLLPSREQYFPSPAGAGSVQYLLRFLIHFVVPSFCVHSDHSSQFAQFPSTSFCVSQRSPFHPGSHLHSKGLSQRPFTHPCFLMQCEQSSPCHPGLQ